MFVDRDKVKRLKAEAAAASDDVGFVSTNDVLMSSLGKLTGARLMFMAVNFRDRVHGIVDSDAGNYESLMMFDEGVYKSPAGFRTALNAMKEKVAVGENGETSSAPVICMT